MSAQTLPSLSVLVPNYNHAKYLDFSLPAILRQSVQPLELLVMDDASTDNSIEVIRRYTAQYPVVRLLQNEKNLGVMPTLNKGLELARGAYVYTASADDEVLPGLFEKSLRLLAEHPQAVLSCGASRWRYVDSGVTWDMGVGLAEKACFLSPEELVRIGRRGKLLLPTSSAIWRKDALIASGGFIPELRWHSDWFATMIPALRSGLCYVPEPVSLFNIYSKSYYQSGRKRGEHRQVLIRLIEFLNSPAYADVRPRVRDAGALSLFEMPMLRILLSRPEYRSFINWTLLRRTVWRKAEVTGGKVLPSWLARWILNRLYRQSSSNGKTPG